MFLGINTTKDHSWASVAKLGYFPPSQYFEGKSLSWLPLLSNAFVHVEIAHIFFNMYWLFYMGPLLEREFGSWKSLAFVITAAIASSGWQLATGNGGIGFSGVGYALVGFGWIAAQYRPSLRFMFSQRTFMIFVGWGILCIFLNAFHIMAIGNVAHAVGLGFGILVALASFKKSILAWIGVVAVFAASFVPLYWNPKSSAWCFVAAMKAYDRRDFNRAAEYFEMSVDEDTDHSAAWYDAGLAYARAQNPSGYKRSFEALAKINPSKAKQLASEFYNPTENPEFDAQKR